MVFFRAGFSLGIRVLILLGLFSGFHAAAFSRTAEAGKLEPVPILGALIGVPYAIPHLVFCKDPGRRRTLKPIALRSYSSFTMDPVSHERYWVESGGQVGYWEDHGRELAVRKFTTSIFCGFRKWEYGVSVPYIDFDTDFYNVQTRYEGPEPYVWTPDGDNLERPKPPPGSLPLAPFPHPAERGIGDIKISGKRVWERGDLLSYSAGFRVSVPVAPEEKGIGTGEVSFTPFVSGGVNLLGLNLRAYTGYEIFNESTNSVPDSFLYGGSLLFRLGKHVAVRTELNGFRFNSKNYISVEPGL
ncbi:MAG TPA: hypothetical protein VLB09_02300, partial [Nitrospiria bacterium]|nr:hypothetical protein [Nitrospiria bacterium]